MYEKQNNKMYFIFVVTVRNLPRLKKIKINTYYYYLKIKC